MIVWVWACMFSVVFIFTCTGHSIEITTDEHGPAATSTENNSKDEEDDDEEVEPSVLQALSSEQLARRPSFK